jgi:hypothetical protein
LVKRAKDAIQLGGMRAFIGTVIPSARTAFNRSIAARIAGPLMRVGPERIWSSKETRSPYGTSSSRCRGLGHHRLDFQRHGIERVVVLDDAIDDGDDVFGNPDGAIILGARPLGLGSACIVILE